MVTALVSEMAFGVKSFFLARAASKEKKDEARERTSIVTAARERIGIATISL
ncbi:MAG: hypothetical protein ACLP7Q_26420 [Isosphaeraceae bacterium]